MIIVVNKTWLMITKTIAYIYYNHEVFESIPKERERKKRVDEFKV
jgi:hypothetical protein